LTDRDRELIKHAAEEAGRAAGREAARETFVVMGLNPDEPQEAQETMAFVRSLKEATDTVRTTGLRTAVGLVVAMLLGLVALGARAKWFGG
jgi:hypothetical protein